ncbi:hypothetical protein JYU34_015073 [Plutella xylostella]|uniref:Uncharacterized protein n=1 Tax=Plutella xylostella TaxID=51655 RepID=A0ABQ7Q682_PLUXY|nr:hypothetical protein JYU34_015066 [Plutella xylostella]KAG7300747.1 hypothetical protein JYU34_015073 [Plutella xylostella]
MVSAGVSSDADAAIDAGHCHRGPAGALHAVTVSSKCGRCLQRAPRLQHLRDN